MEGVKAWLGRSVHPVVGAALAAPEVLWASAFAMTALADQVVLNARRERPSLPLSRTTLAEAAEIGVHAFATADIAGEVGVQAYILALARRAHRG